MMVFQGGDLKAVDEQTLLLSRVLWLGWLLT
jgi:hypothetical protein